MDVRIDTERSTTTDSYTDTRLKIQERTRDIAHKGETTMNAQRISIVVIISALMALMLAPGVAANELRFEVDRTSDGMAHYQIVDVEWIGEPDAGVVLDYETMKFLEENTLGYHAPDARFAQVDTADAIAAYTAPCQGEGLVNDAEARAGITGSIENYCSGEDFAESLGGRDDNVAPSIPMHPDWPDGFNDAPLVPPHSAWPPGAFDY